MGGRLREELIDSNAQSDGEYVVADFKTTSGGESRNTIKENIQINTYCLAVQHKYGKLPARASLVYLKGRKGPVHYYPDACRYRAKKRG